MTLNAVHSVKAHDAEINCVTVSPHDKFIATAALDKTAKVIYFKSNFFKNILFIKM